MSWTFISSVADPAQCPAPDKPEFAFVGRSNVGKSSLINRLAGVSNLARVSSTPGKTQTINHYLVDESWYLVDLPGYGFAKVAKSLRGSWQKFISAYLTSRENLLNLYVLVDARLPMQEIDRNMMQWLGENAIPFTLIFTKSDKLGKNVLRQKLADYEKALARDWDPIPPYLVSSAETGMGKEEILKDINRIMKEHPLK